MAIQKIQPSYKFNEEQLKQLRQIIPEAFRDNILDFNALYEALSDSLEDDDLETEHFGLMWPGKKEAKRTTAIPSRGSLAPSIGMGINEGNTKNSFIEGDNLEVLKLLQKSYTDSVKLIYIDPPYNTGNDFIYDDDFSESLSDYLYRTNQIDDIGRRLTTNTKSDGRFHSKWLSMMYPRLKLARNLLTDDGVIFISIDDNELHNLKALCNEIFGEENFIDIFSWMKTETPANLSLKSKKAIEYIICFQKNKNSERFKGLQKKSSSDNPLIKPQNTLKELTFKKEWIITNMKDSKFKKGVYGTDNNKIVLKNDVEVKNKKFLTDVILEAKFIWTPEKLKEEIDNGTEIRIKTKTFVPSYEKANYEPEVPWNIINRSFGVGTNDNATTELSDLFGKKVFDYPKPTSLLEYLIQFVCEDNDIVMDFFAGSGTTGHAAINYALKNKINLQYIIVQLPVELDSNNEVDRNALEMGYKTLADVTFARLIKTIEKNKIELESSEILYGIKKYVLSNSNFKKWQNFTGQNTKELENLFSQFESPLVDDWKPENLLTEILLIEGFPLESKIEAVETFKKNRVQKVTSDFCEHALFVCLDKKVGDETIKALSLGGNDIFICLDNAVTDQDKARLDDKGLIKTI